MQLTNKVLDEMQKSRDYYQDAKPFIVKAFPNSLAVQNEFGFNDYKLAQKGQDSMTKFMAKFHKIATKYDAELIAKNYTQIMIDEILVRHDKLKEADITQELFIKNRPVKTADRITKLNKAWNGETIVCAAGKRIYKDNYAKYQRYLLPPGEEAVEILSVTGKITNSATAAAEAGVEVGIEALGVSVISDSEGNYEIGGLPAGTYTLVFSKASLQDKTIANVVVVDGEPTTLDVVMDPV
ncbi:MAG: carboxypeptidase-like regulatory domain-containing protein [Bacteroidota bacterium]